MFDLATRNLCVPSRFATQMDGTLNLDLRSLMSDSELILNLELLTLNSHHSLLITIPSTIHHFVDSMLPWHERGLAIRDYIRQCGQS